MGVRHQTCKTCDYVKFNGMGVPYCSKRKGKPVVPFYGESIYPESHVIFYRVPMACPLSDKVVDKREEGYQHEGEETVVVPMKEFF